MVRDNANDFSSNANSTPIEVFQHNWFREGYFKAAVTIDHGRHEMKFGVESDNTFLNENFSYIITDPTQFDDPARPSPFTFVASRPDLEQSVFVQDLMRLGNWTINAGLRWDHYQLLLNRQAVSPVSRFRAISHPPICLAFFLRPSFSDARLSRTSCFRVQRLPRPSTRSPCNYPSSLPKETTTKRA